MKKTLRWWAGGGGGGREKTREGRLGKGVEVDTEEEWEWLEGGGRAEVGRVQQTRART